MLTSHNPSLLPTTKATGLQLQVWILENGKRNARVLAEETFILNDMPEGVMRTEALRLQSLIREGAVLEMEIFGDNIPSQTFELSLNYSKVKGR